MTHRRRKNGIKSALINFNPEMKFTGQKGTFLTNNLNKQRMIWLIGDIFIKYGCTVHRAPKMLISPL